MGTNFEPAWREFFGFINLADNQISTGLKNT